MLIKEVSIKNFRSYYGMNSFELGDRLTLIIGDNGDGKTTFFEALEWLFNTSTEDKRLSNISAKRISELGDGESDEVCVSIDFVNEDGIKTVEKSFTFTNDSGRIKMDNFRFIGRDNSGPERELRDGRKMLESCFDTGMRRYCLFKGENDLNVFSNDDAIEKLVEKFSDIKDFDSYVELVNTLEQKSRRAYDKELRSDKKTQSQAKFLSDQMDKLDTKISDDKQDLRIYQKSSDDYDARIEVLNENEETRHKYADIQARLATKNEQRRKADSMAKINYNFKLLDDKWILCAFPDILRDYRLKISGFSRKKRKEEEAYREATGELKGETKTLKLLKGSLNDKGPEELPWDIPGIEVMKEMIRDHKCKICGHPAPEGSPELEYMKKRVTDYEAHLEQRIKENEAEMEQRKPLFPYNYLNELRALSTSLGGERERDVVQLKNEISDKVKLIARLKADVAKYDQEIEEMENDKKNLFIQANISEAAMNQDITDITGFFKEKSKADKEIARLTYEIQKLEGDLDDLKKQYNQLAPSSGMGKVYERVHNAFAQILFAFTHAREDNLRHFIDELTAHANKYLEELNMGDFHGEVVIEVHEDGKAKIYLVSSHNRERIDNPNGALKTTMYMSVLFAISDITTIKREEDYPLIFDAPTSSFGEVKEDVFYNTITSIKKQCVIVTKDLLEHNAETGRSVLNEEKINNLNCSVYRIKKNEDFDPSDLSTIYINVEKIK